MLAWRRSTVLLAIVAVVLLGGGIALSLSHPEGPGPAGPCLGGGSAVDQDGTVHCVGITYHGKPITAEKLAELRGRTPFYSLQIGLRAEVFDTQAEYDAAVADFCRHDPRRARLPHCRPSAAAGRP